MTEQTSQQLPFSVRNDEETNLPAMDTSQLGIPTEPSDGGSDQTQLAESVQVSENAMRNVLSLLFKAGYMYYGHDHWIEGTDEEIEMLVPIGMQWVNRWPALAAAVERVDMESFPVVFLYSVGKRVIISERIKKADRMEAQGQTAHETASTAAAATNGGKRDGQLNVPLTF